MKAPAVLPASYSSISAYETCPKQYYHLRILKDVKQEESKEMAWGNAVHKALENNIKYQRPLPETMSMYQWGLDVVAKRQADTALYAELDVAVNAAYRPVDFWDSHGYVRGKIDVLAMDEAQTKAMNGDWKTGKTKPNSQQLTLSTLLCFHSYPALEKVRTVFFWLPETDPRKRTTQKLFIRRDSDVLQTTDDKGKQTMLTFEEAWEPFVNTIDQMKWSLQHDTWPAKPSGLCKAWCPVLSCPHNGRR